MKNLYRRLWSDHIYTIICIVILLKQFERLANKRGVDYRYTVKIYTDVIFVFL